jgi:lipopolysaccharide export system permease protein
VLVFRYLSKQILQVMVAVTLVLLVVALTSRFIQYLGDAVAGQLASDILLLLMLYRLPDFLLVILPLALFLGIILAYGRLYADNEMVILMGSGYSQRRLLLTTLAGVSVVIVIMALLSLVLAPWGVRNTEQIKLSQQELTEIDLIVAGQFQRFGDDSRVTYAERIESTAGGRQLENVFVALNSAAAANGGAPRIVLAESARPQIDADSGARFMRLENVLQYDGEPGRADFSIARFDVQGILLPEPTQFEAVLEQSTLPSLALLGSSDPALRAELQWRLSTILLIPVITLIAVPMSRVDPRQGRFSKLIPAALLYACYFVLLQFCRDLVAEGSLSPLPGLWWVHLLFIAIGWYSFRNQGRLLFDRSAWRQS